MPRLLFWMLEQRSNQQKESKPTLIESLPSQTNKSRLQNKILELPELVWLPWRRTAIAGICSESRGFSIPKARR